MSDKYFIFRQNNPGGRFIFDLDITKNMVIKAPDARTANAAAESIGIYFDGVAKDIDCPCCGNRWSRVSDSDSGWDWVETIEKVIDDVGDEQTYLYVKGEKSIVGDYEKKSLTSEIKSV